MIGEEGVGHGFYGVWSGFLTALYPLGAMDYFRSRSHVESAV